MKRSNPATVKPSASSKRVVLPDETPAIVSQYATSPAQMMLSRIRHNRLIDRFTGSIAYFMESKIAAGSPDFPEGLFDELYLVLHGSTRPCPVAVFVPTRGRMLNLERYNAINTYCLANLGETLPRILSAHSALDEFEHSVSLIEVSDDDQRLIVLEEVRYRCVLPAYAELECPQRFARGRR